MLLTIGRCFQFDIFQMSSLLNVLLSLTVLVASIITMLCSTPPNATPYQEWKRDRLGVYASSRAAVIHRTMVVGTGIYHAALVLTWVDATTTLCPRPENLNRQLFQWNWYTCACLFLIICVGGPLRFSAFAWLGQNFTFRLGPSSKLVTTGIYRYIQHPSYSGQVIVLVSNLSLFYRLDGSLACWLPGCFVAALDGWGILVCGVIIFGMFRWLILRVEDEEEMLRITFGQEWENWNRSTKRFIPWIF
jgi:protein-S-isoprenylcysteine O-methyltransferase Ste14